MDEPSEKEILWRDYALNAQLYQFYLDMTVKVELFYYGITGGMVSFCLARPKTDYTKWALIFPMIMGLCFALIFAYSSFLAKNMRHDTAAIASRLNLDMPHEYSPLTFLLITFAITKLICVAGVAFLLWKLAT